MDLETYKGKVITNVYHLDAERDVPFHNHPTYDELFYCIKGEGFGVLEEGSVELSLGQVFRVPAGMMHTLRTEKDLFVCSFLIPPVED